MCGENSCWRNFPAHPNHAYTWNWHDDRSSIMSVFPTLYQLLVFGGGASPSVSQSSGLPPLRSCWGEAFPARGPQWNLSISIEISTWLPNVNSERQDGGAHWATLSIYWRASRTFVRKVLLAVTVHLPNRVWELRNWLTRTQILGKSGYSKCRALG